MNTVKYAVAVALMMALVTPTVTRADRSADDLVRLYEYCESKYPDHSTLHIGCFRVQRRAIQSGWLALKANGVIDANGDIIEAAKGTKHFAAIERCLVEAYQVEFKTSDYVQISDCLEAVKDAYGTFRK